MNNESSFAIWEIEGMDSSLEAGGIIQNLNTVSSQKGSENSRNLDTRNSTVQSRSFSVEFESVDTTRSGSIAHEDSPTTKTYDNTISVQTIPTCDENSKISNQNVSFTTNGISVNESTNMIPANFIFANTAIKTRPCDECRKRKARCVLEKGSAKCERCAERGLACTFIQGPRPRGKPREKEVSKEVSDMVSDSSSTGPEIKKRKIDVNESNTKYVTPIQDYSNIQGRSLLKKTMSLQHPRSSFYVGSTSVYDSKLFDSSEFDKLDQIKLVGDINVRKPGPDVYFTLTNDYSYDEMIADVDAVEKLVSPHGESLIHLYFRIVHPSFPILAKNVFLEKYARTHREFAAPLLAGVYILALNWWYYDAKLAYETKPNVYELQQLARRTFSKLSERPKLSSVQAGLLLLQSHPNQFRNWGLCCQVTALAEELGLGLNCQNWRLPKWERSLRKRLAWAVYLQDKWLSLIESRPSHIQAENWMVKYLTPDDFPSVNNDQDEEGVSNIEDGKLLFIEMIRLGSIVSEIMDTLFTFEARQDIRSTEMILEHAKPIQIKLKTWYQKLPSRLRMSTVINHRLSSNGYLHLSYFAAEITLHRRIIRSLSSTSSADLIKVCRSAAKERLVGALDFIKKLRNEHMRAFWHFSASSNFALIGSFAAILYVTSDNEIEAEFYKTQLIEFIWTMRLFSEFKHMAAALEILTIALSGVPGLQNIGVAESTNDVDEPEDDEDSYEDTVELNIKDEEGEEEVGMQGRIDK